MERHQSGLGQQLGRPAGARHHRPADQAHARVRRRRVSEFQGQGRRVHPQRVFRQVSRAAEAGGAHVRRRDGRSAARRPRSAEGLQRLQARRGAQRIAHRDPGQDHQRLRAGRSGRRPQRHASAEEAERRRDALLPPPLRYSDFRRDRPHGFVLSAAGGQPRDALSPRAAGSAGRQSAGAFGAEDHHPGAAARSLRGIAGRVAGPRSLHHDGVRPRADAPAQGQESKPVHRADHPGRSAHVRHGIAVPAVRHLRQPRPALQAGGQREFPVLQGSQERPDPGRRASPKPDRWLRSPPRAQPTPTTACR